MKVNRVDNTGINSSSPFWLYEFAHDLDKKANQIDYLKEYLDKTYKKKKFNTIEEKLADIRDRVGFDVAKKIINELEKKSNTAQEEKTANEESCGCKKPCKCKEDCKCKVTKTDCGCNKKTASHDHDHNDEAFKRREEKMQVIMDYIKEMIKDYVSRKLDVNEIIIIRACKSNNALGFESVNIDEGILKEFINYEINKYKKSDEPRKESYIPMVDTYNPNPEDQVADYYSHGRTSLS
jgi:hypothetical protein